MTALARLFPDDTRLAEIASFWCHILLAFGLASGWLTLGDASDRIDGFWAALCLILGPLQASAVLTWPDAAPVRVITAWMSGLLWLWLGVDGLLAHQLGGLGMIVLGIGNLYASVLRGKPAITMPLEDILAFEDTVDERRRVERVQRWNS